MDDKERALSLRRLRFPPDLERDFRLDYAERSVVYSRWVCALWFFLTFLNGVTAATAENPQALAIFKWFGVCLPIVALSFWLTFPRPLRPHMQAVIGSTILLFFITVQVLEVRETALLVDPRVNPDAKAVLQDNVAAWCVNILAFYTVARLRLVPAVIVCWTLILFRAAWLIGPLGAPAAWVQEGFQTLLIANILGMTAGYLIEHSARRDFLLSRLLAEEQQKSERLLLNILPPPIADRLKRRPGTVADSFAEVTVLFADLVDFTPLSARMSAEELVSLLNDVFSRFDELADRLGLEKIKTIGDSYMVVGGIPQPRQDHAEAIAEMALAMCEELERLGREKDLPLRLRAGINTGPVVAGVIGTRKFIYDLWGDTVNLASRMESHGAPGRIQVTPAVYERLKDRYRFEERDPIQVKGRGEMVTYLLLGKREDDA
jgi:class 3 adenylate cyclase